MRFMIALVGIILIIAGLVPLGYKGFSYKTEEKVAELKVGGVSKFELTEQKEKSIPISPVLGGVSIVIGILLVALARGRKP